MSTPADLDEVLGLIERLCRPNPTSAVTADVSARLARVGGARGLAVFLVPREGHAELLASHGIPVDYLRRFPPREAVPFARFPGDLRAALAGGETTGVARLTEDPRTVSLSSVALEGRFASTLAIPLVHGRRIMGALHAFYGDVDDARSQRRLLQIAPIFATSFMAGATGAGQVFDRLVTGDVLRAGVARIHAGADRYQRPYCVTVYVLDGPEFIAQRYGAGLVAEADAELGRIVAAEARTADLSGLIGPGAYATVMVETGQDGAYVQVQRVLDRFGRRAFAHGDARVALSVSAGISCFPENGALDGAATVRSARRAVRDAAGPTGQRIVAIAARGSAAEA